MHYYCSTFGSSGDVFPMLGLALELKRRGHEVSFATNGHFESMVRRHGLPFEPLGSEELYQETISHPDLWHPQKAFAYVFRSLQPVLKRQYELHAQAVAAGPTIGITNVFGMGALLAREKLKLPVLTLHLQPAVLWSDHQPPELPGVFGPRWLKNILFRIGERIAIDPVVCPFLNPWRAELGLPPVKRITRWWNSPDGVICLFPEWFASPQPDWPQPLVQTDFPLWNDASNAGLPADVDVFLKAGTPPLVFTPGTANTHGRAFFEASVDACRQLGRRGILLAGFPDQLPQTLPEGVIHFRYVPLDLLLPRCAAFIHHGGVGSASQGLAAGIPQVVMPLAHDQFDNVARLKKLGVGDSLLPAKFTGERLAEKLRPLLDSPKVGEAARQLARKLDSRDGLARTAVAVEKMLPIPASRNG